MLPLTKSILLKAHTVLVVFSMICWEMDLFRSGIPFDCVYTPLFFVSGPFVYTVAHTAQHSIGELLFPCCNRVNLSLAWNLTPGLVCLILGGLQWYYIEKWWKNNIKKPTGDR